MAFEPFNWKCPYCERDVTITQSRHRTDYSSTHDSNNSAEGPRGIRTVFIICPNDSCRKTTIFALLFTSVMFDGELIGAGVALERWRLAPWGASRTFPEYVPQAIREDYKEACSIKDLSAKAAATLARRAVQGIIRDYWGIAKSRLIDEIAELKKLIGTRDVTPELCDNIDAIREVGNIGAHMEKDVNIIVDVEPDEAELLIGLVESLIDDTYIARNARQERNAKLLKMKAEKHAAKTPPSA